VISPARWPALLLAVLVVACGDTASSTDGPGGLGGEGGSRGTPDIVAPLPWPLTAFPQLPDSMQGVPEARVELGHLLFVDPVLSVDRETACITCHSERWGMGDGLPRAIGHGAGLLAGPGRQGPNQLRRNSPSIYNLAFRPSLLWDGDAQTLEEQALIPIFAEDEMSADPVAIVAELTSISEYVELFAEAFPDDPRVSVENLASALAAYQRTFISNRSTYDVYVEDRPGVMTDDQREGMFLFAEMGCDGCHTPPLFESETFANRNVPEVEGIVDHGLEERTGLEEDRGKFRTVTLRNLRSSEPYFHNGSVLKLGNAIRHEMEQTGLPFTEEDLRLITIFIDKALRDERLEVIRPVSVPSGLPIPIDPPGSR
jgi:cytochrome c peroxidase